MSQKIEISKVKNINLSNDKIYINDDSGTVKYYDLERKIWKSIPEDDGIFILLKLTKEENFSDALDKIKDKKTIKNEIIKEDSFYISNLRPQYMSSDDLKDFILSTTRGKYIDEEVRKEISGKRPSLLKEYIKALNYDCYTNVFLIVSSYKINPNKENRYCIFLENDCQEIINIFNDFIPVYKIEQIESNTDVSTLSKWFRDTLGYGFCVTDIDFILKNNNKILIIEEKKGKIHNTSTGQNLSRKEILKDVIKDCYNKKYLYVEIDSSEIIVEHINENKMNKYKTTPEVISEIIGFLGGVL